MKKIFLLLCVAALTFTACSDSYMESVNTDDSKVSKLDPNAQLTTALLQTYGDFSMMDTYRNYITGFAQYFAGGWNVTYYAGCVHWENDICRKVWDRFYELSIKNLVDGIHNSEGKPNLNAALRIHRVYLMVLLADTYGDLPCTDAGLGYISGNSTPKYDTVEDVYNWAFTELDACEKQLGTGSDHLTGDVTSMGGDVNKWKKYVNSLRMRYAMRISDVKPDKAQEEFEKAMNSGYISTASDDAYVVYSDKPYTEYPGSVDYDLRTNNLCQILYGQDAGSPTLVCSMLFNQLKKTNDPRLYRIVRHYYNIKRNKVRPDKEGNIDLTDDIRKYFADNGRDEMPCNPGAASWHNWVDAVDASKLPTLAPLAEADPVNYNNSDYLARATRPWLSIDLEMNDCPGILITSAEVEFLLAEAADKGWNVSGTAQSHYEAGVRASMEMLNNYYLTSNKITDDEINTFIAQNPLGSNPKETINTQAWILHLTNPSEGWANLRRSDYPAILDRTRLESFSDGFVCDDSNMNMPTRLKYPDSEKDYNNANYQEALNRNMGGNDDWHKRLWWDVADVNVQATYSQPYYKKNSAGERYVEADFGYIK